MLLLPFEAAIDVVRYEKEHTELLEPDKLHISLIPMTRLKPFQQSFWVYIPQDARVVISHESLKKYAH